MRRVKNIPSHILKFGQKYYKCCLFELDLEPLLLWMGEMFCFHVIWPFFHKKGVKNGIMSTNRQRAE